MEFLPLLLSFLLAQCIAPVYTWSLVYSHNALGSTLFGSRQALIKAVKDGRRIRLGVPNGSGDYYTTNVNSLSIQGGHVTAQSLDHVSKSGPNRFQDNAYWWFTMITTDGTRQMARWNVGSHTNRGYSKDKTAVQWYADEPCRWKLAYEHDANGNKVQGEKSTLEDAVKAGADVRGVSASSAFDMQNVVVTNGGSICGMTVDHISKSIASNGQQMEIQPNAYWWFSIVCVNGQRDMSRWSVGEHTDRGHTQDRTAMKWYISA